MEMRDPSTAASRIYIGNLSENITKADVENQFKRYGNIRGIMTSRSFGFVQYDSEESANNAIKNEHENMFFQRKIIVRNAMQGTGDKNTGNNSNASNAQAFDNNNRGQRPQWNQRNNNRNQQQRGGGGGGGGGGNAGDKNRQMNDRDRSPLDRGRGPNMDDRWNQGPNNQNNFGPNQGGMNRGGIGSGMNAGMSGGPSSGMNEGMGGVGMNEGMNRGMGGGNNMPGGNMLRELGGPDMGNRMGGRGNIAEPGIGGNNMGPGHGLGGGQTFPGNVSAQSIRAKHPDANDCEIIVVSKHLTQYAEIIEARLKRLGLLVDLLFPNEDVPIGRVLANIASRGCLYAILVTPQNQELRSITVNILYAQPAEHRNMPVDDAVEFIYNNFRSLMRGGPVDYPDGDPQSQYASVPLSTTRHPDSVRPLINLLAEDRVLTVLQYDCLIKYLQERRENQVKVELGDSSDLLTSTASASSATTNAPAPQANNGPDPEQAEKELQRKIMEILNKPSITNMPTEAPISSNRNIPSNPQPVPAPAPAPAPALAPALAPAPSNNGNQQDPQLLNDPKVQKALESLLSNNSYNF